MYRRAKLPSPRPTSNRAPARLRKSSKKSALSRVGTAVSAVQPPCAAKRAPVPDPTQAASPNSVTICNTFAKLLASRHETDLQIERRKRRNLRNTNSCFEQIAHRLNQRRT